MKTMMKHSVLALTVILALGACQQKKAEKPAEGGLVVEVADPKSDQSAVTVTKDSKIVVDGKGLADAGEQLVGPYTFMLADKVFDTALQVDPNNKKAQFYKSLLKRLMVFKGVLTRVNPMIRANGGEAKHKEMIAQLPHSPAKDFLLEGTEDIRTYSDVQNIVAEYVQALNDFRKFAKSNSDLELTLNLNPHVFEKELREQVAESCIYKPAESDSVKVVCDYTKVAQKKINSADMVAFAQITGGEMLMWSMYNSYDLSTIEKLMQDKNFVAQTKQQQLETLKTMPSIAKLRADQTLSLIPELGADMVGAFKWAKQYQANLCPHGETAKNRRGFVFDKGFCVKNSSESDRSLALLEQALRGAVRLPVTDSNDRQTGEITVDFVRFLSQPPQDLRSVLPNKIDAEGKVIEHGDDKTFGGLFPNGDVDSLTKNN